MPTKAELTQDIYLLLGVIHLHGFVMSPEMGQRIFDRWPAVMGPRPESAEAIINDYNAILQQVTAKRQFDQDSMLWHSLPWQTPAETLAKTSRTPKNQKAVKKDNHDSPFNLARSKNSAAISRVFESEPAMNCKKESSANPSLPATSASNKDIEVIDLTDDIDDHKDSPPNVYPTRKRLCPLDFTSHSVIKKEEHELGPDEKISDEFITSLLDDTPSKKPKME